MSELTIGDETTRKALLVMIASIGRRPVYIVDWGIRDKQGNRIGDPEKESILRLANQPPTALKEGEYKVVGTSDLSILPDTQQIYARDSTGKEWKVARRYLKKLGK